MTGEGALGEQEEKRGWTGDGTPHRHGDVGQGARGREGHSERARAPSGGAAGLGHELPAR